MRGSSSWAGDSEASSTSTSTSDQRHRPSQLGSSRHSNVFKLLALREVCPRTKCSSRKLWRDDSNDLRATNFPETIDARRDLLSWVEAESLQHLSAKYCPLLPPPRSTIAAAFSRDGKTLASTHGDHTVKIIDCQTGRCLMVLSGHRRTPWVVRFHPLYPDILASGSLDHEVRLWDAKTAKCIGSRDFSRPIASIAFHSCGEILAVASGHKLYIWHYSKKGESPPPTIILKTRRSLRAVHFHPYAAPFLLTAEVNDIDSSDSSMTLATSPGYLQYPPPTVYLADTHSSDYSSLANELNHVPLPFMLCPSFARDNGRTSLQHAGGNDGWSSGQQRSDQSASVRLLTYSTPTGQYELLLSPIEPNSSSPHREETGPNSLPSEMETDLSHSTVEPMETVERQPTQRSNQFFPFGDPALWDISFLQGWLIGQTQGGQYNIRLPNSSGHENTRIPAGRGTPTPIDSSATQAAVRLSTAARSGSRHRSSRSRIISGSGSGEGAGYNNIMQDGSSPQPAVRRIQSELATSLAAAAAAELPCTVKLRIWMHDVKTPCAPLDPEKCRLTIPHAVLCSEMGAHFSPCGRFLAACVACVLPHTESDPGPQSQHSRDATGISTSPTRHPMSAHQVIYELRIYSVEEATFGLVLASRAIRAAHCLTSIQFSPTSEHILLAYGRRHSSLLKTVLIDEENTIPIFTILEVYSVSDMELVRVLPNAEDEVNVSCFHPSVGGGLVYGTKEGKLRILQYQYANSLGVNNRYSGFFNGNMLEVPAVALEC